MGCDETLFGSSADTIKFQSTHPSWGATLEGGKLQQSIGDFNPRTHRGVRQDPADIPLSPFTISIHAPIVGCDLVWSKTSDAQADFNPRTHRGVRLGNGIKSLFGFLFQSTHPSWGATSIPSVLPKMLDDFNPRTHRGVRPYQMTVSKNSQ